MPTLPRVVSPVRPLFTRDDIDIALISVELWPDHVVVRLAALPNEITVERQRRYEVEFGALGLARDPPDQPGMQLLAPLEIAVEDDQGTRYDRRSSNTGGTGSEWHGDWFFAGEVPTSIARITVRVSSPDGETAAVALDLSGV